MDKCESEEHWENQSLTEKWTFVKMYRAGTKWRLRHSAKQKWILFTIECSRHIFESYLWIVLGTRVTHNIVEIIRISKPPWFVSNIHDLNR